jgi:isoleucyl-tRNA synthetase
MSVVHCALAFGEDDHCVCLAVGIFEVGIILL